MKKKQIRSMLLVMIAVAMMMCAVGSTMAWLQDSTEDVVNTFTPSHIDVTLTETERPYQMVPGWILPKDPKVTVAANSEECHVFLKVEESDNFDAYIAYALDSKWVLVDGQTNVYSQIVSKSTSPTDLKVLVAGTFNDPMGEGDSDDVTISWGDNQVGVKPSVTEEMMDTADSSKPTITFTAYAVQRQKSNVGNDAEKYFTPAQAWAQIAH